MRSELIFECLPSYRVVPKSHNFSYVHHSGSTSDIDHIICSPGIISSSASVHVNEQDTDQMPISATFTMDIDLSETNCSREKSKRFEKSNWSKANIKINWSKATLTSLLSTIRVPYHLLQRQVLTNGKADIDCYYNQLVICMKREEEAAVPRQRIRKRTQKTIWSMDPCLKSIKNKAKLWLQIWNECGRPSSGCVTDIKLKTKTNYKRYLRSARYRGMDFPVSREDWRKVINSDKINDETMTSNCLLTSAWLTLFFDFFSD